MSPNKHDARVSAHKGSAPHETFWVEVGATDPPTASVPGCGGLQMFATIAKWLFSTRCSRKYSTAYCVVRWTSAAGFFFEFPRSRHICYSPPGKCAHNEGIRLRHNLVVGKRIQRTEGMPIKSIYSGRKRIFFPSFFVLHDVCTVCTVA